MSYIFSGTTRVAKVSHTSNGSNYPMAYTFATLTEPGEWFGVNSMEEAMRAIRNRYPEAS